MAKFESTGFDIVVVGSGMVGGTLAALVASLNKDLRIAVVDASTPAKVVLDSYDARVVALSKCSEAILRKAGVWGDVTQLRVCPYSEMHVWDGEGTAEIRFDANELKQDNLGHIVENRLLIAALDARLKQSKNIECFYDARVESLEKAEHNQLSITLENGLYFEAALVVAADGAESKLRSLADLKLRQWDYGQKAIVTTVRTELPHAGVARQRFSQTGPLAFLPLADNDQKQNYCSIVWSLDDGYAEEVMALSDKDFCQQLASTFEYRLGKIEHCDKRYSFPLKQRHATRYADGNLILVGDAAHTIHPLAGQGANLGLYDAQALVQEIERAVARGVPLWDASIGKRFERQRQPHNLLAMSTMEFFKRLFGAKSLALLWLRNEGVRTVSAAPWIKKHLARLASGEL